jgi:hypothetical protein
MPLSFIWFVVAGLKAERAQFADVSRALEKVATERGLQLNQNWLNKCIQLYETYLVRASFPEGLKCEHSPLSVILIGDSHLLPSTNIQNTAC